MAKMDKGDFQSRTIYMKDANSEKTPAGFANKVVVVTARVREFRLILPLEVAGHQSSAIVA
jgi:hypothetical protein